MHSGRIVFLTSLIVVALATATGVATLRASKARLERIAIDHRAQTTGRERASEEVARAEANAADLRLAAWQREAEQLARDIERLRAETAAREAAPRPQRLASSSLAAAPRPTNPWPNAGQAAPLATFQTVQWAINEGDVDTLEQAIAFDPAAREAAQQFFEGLDPESKSEFRTPQRLVASVMAAKSRSEIVDAQVVSATVEPDGAQAVRLSLASPRGKTREIAVRFQVSTEGWRLVVPAKIVTSYRNLMLGPVIDPKTYKVVR